MPHILKSTPVRPAPFPPPLGKKAHRVRTGDNWWNLASRYGRTDPWDIIEFNFHTRNPREVNWYLEFYVGCTRPADDGKNYRFDGSDNPGTIYIPPSSWTPSEDLALRQEVAFALAGPVVARVNVLHGGRAVIGRSLAAVGVRVLEGDIGVTIDPSLNSDEAEYNSGTNTLHLGFRRAPTWTKKALIVHEAVHAVLDMRAASGLTIAESESLAYVVQCFYMHEHTPDPTTERLEDDNERKDHVYEIAWGMAAKLARGTQPSATEWLALDHAVRRHPKYKKTAGNTADFDGI
jgi:hypothetical protein